MPVVHFPEDTRDYSTDVWSYLAQTTPMWLLTHPLWLAHAYTQWLAHTLLWSWSQILWYKLLPLRSLVNTLLRHSVYPLPIRGSSITYIYATVLLTTTATVPKTPAIGSTIPLSWPYLQVHSNTKSSALLSWHEANNCIWFEPININNASCQLWCLGYKTCFPISGRSGNATIGCWEWD